MYILNIKRPANPPTPGPKKTGLEIFFPAFLDFLNVIMINRWPKAALPGRSLLIA
jgi:hypothetical protein